MTTKESTPPDTQADSPGSAHTGPNWGRWISLIAWLGFLGLFAAVARTDVDPRVANPNVEGRPRPVEFLTGFDHWQDRPAGRRLDHGRGADHRLHPWLAEEPRQPGADDGPGYDADRLAGPDHELVAIRGLQPDVVALAGILAPGHDVADRRTLHRVRVRDVLLRPVLPGDLDSPQDAGEARSAKRSSPGIR